MVLACPNDAKVIASKNELDSKLALDRYEA